MRGNNFTTAFGQQKRRFQRSLSEPLSPRSTLRRVGGDQEDETGREEIKEHLKVIEKGKVAEEEERGGPGDGGAQEGQKKERAEGDGKQKTEVVESGAGTASSG